MTSNKGLHCRKSATGNSVEQAPVFSCHMCCTMTCPCYGCRALIARRMQLWLFIVLNRPILGVTQRLREAYPQNYQMNDAFFLIQSETLAESIATTVGLKGDGRIRQASCSESITTVGYASRSLWEWLTQAEKKECASAVFGA